MADIITSKTFVDGEKGITAAKMNQIISGSVIQPAFYSAKPSSPTLDPTDVLLELKGTGAYAQITGSQLINSVGTTLAVVTSFVTKSAAYTLLPSDSNKYIICSGGSWSLTLPTPATGLNFRVRNDMGIASGSTTGTITLQTAGGTIDGQVSIPLLPQQECAILTDGTNWRTFGKQREVVLGTLDITSATASASVLLPAGYRLFLLDLTSLACSVDNQNLQMTLSSDGGSTYYSAGYNYEYFLNSAAATLIASGGNIFYGYIGALGSTSGGAIQIKIYPGSSTQKASWQAQSDTYASAGAYVAQSVNGGILSIGTLAMMNAVKFVPVSGTINNMFLTVKGVV